MGLTERQAQVLESVIAQYIANALPVSSQFLADHSKLSVSTATLRNELGKLTELGFLAQPHTAAGRVPTDKGYRFYVDEVVEREIWKTFRIRFQELAKDASKIALWHMLEYQVASLSSTLAVTYAPEQGVIFKNGWEIVLKEPEFMSEEYMARFVRFLQDIDKKMADVSLQESLKIYIGSENPFSKINEFAIMMTPCKVPGYGMGIVALIGPKRMAYPRNIRLLYELDNLLS